MAVEEEQMLLLLVCYSYSMNPESVNESTALHLCDPPTHPPPPKVHFEFRAWNCTDMHPSRNTPCGTVWKHWSGFTISSDVVLRSFGNQASGFRDVGSGALGDECRTGFN